MNEAQKSTNVRELIELARALRAPMRTSWGLRFAWPLAALLALGCNANDRLLEVKSGPGDGAPATGDGALAVDAAARDDARGDEPADGGWLPAVAACGPAGDRCQDAGASCTYCGASGARLGCTCGGSGLWECAPTGGACGVPCGGRNCLPGELCRGLQIDCALRNVPSLPLLYECVPRPSDCLEPSGCACLQSRGCPVSAFFCHDQADAGTIECRCRP
jgi:hypothetical protein